MEWVKPDAIVEGVTIALVAAVILGTYRSLSNWRSQREQTQYFRDIIAIGYENIKEATSLGGIPLDTVRFVEFERILREVSTALNYRTNSLTYPKKYGIQKILIDVSGFMAEMNIGRKDGQAIPQGLRFYKQHFFEKVGSVRWLIDLSP